MLKLPRRIFHGDCGRRVMLELPIRAVSSLIGPVVVHKLPCGKLLRVDGSLGNDRGVRCGRLHGRRGERVLELRCGDVPGQCRPVELLELRRRSIPDKRRPNKLHQLPLGQLLRVIGLGSGVRIVRGWIIRCFRCRRVF